ncbi:MAG: helix-turn-helix transcriptional regulator [Lachnospiraceae bacterium]|nr:helix-turn-helix transcriptional regulator [Lachnospiraceae bacterium]
MNRNDDLAEKQDIVRKNIVEQYITQRKLHNLTQEELASIMGVKRPNISRFETGQYNPTLDLLVKMAECMDLEIEVTLTNKRKGMKDDGKEQ